ncbi:MAG: hypothetical protein ACOCU8_03125 [Patescibacteria group bacterium]
MKLSKICYCGIYDPNYPRSDILISGLKLNGVEIIYCREESNDRYRYLKLLSKIKRVSKTTNLIFVAYPATWSAIIAKIFTNKIIVVDAFYSMYDAVVNDRKECSKFSLKEIKLWLLDWLSINLADLVITDTKTHKKYWSTWPLVKSNKIFSVYLGVNDKFFSRRQNKIINS